MRRYWIVIALLLLAVPAWAQQAPILWLPAVTVTDYGPGRDAPLLPSATLTPPPPGWDRKANVLALTYMGLAAADLALTASCSGAKRCKEMNPLLAPLVNGGHYGWAGALKITINTGTVWAVYRFTAPKSKARYLAFATVIAIQGAVVAYNSSQHVMGK